VLFAKKLRKNILSKSKYRHCRFVERGGVGWLRVPSTKLRRIVAVDNI
jgi:hypothetical protein